MARGEFFRQDGSCEDLGTEEEEGSCVYLGGLPANCTERDIDRFFNGYGRLSLVIMRNKHSFAFIEEERDAREAGQEYLQIGSKLSPGVFLKYFQFPKTLFQSNIVIAIYLEIILLFF